MENNHKKIVDNIRGLMFLIKGDASEIYGDCFYTGISQNSSAEELEVFCRLCECIADYAERAKFLVNDLLESKENLD